jgi:hypothetical protein
MAHMERWQSVFEYDNKFCFVEKSWKLFMNTEPTILINVEWVNIQKKKKWKGYYLNPSLSIGIISWNQLRKIADTI